MDVHCDVCNTDHKKQRKRVVVNIAFMYVHYMKVLSAYNLCLMLYYTNYMLHVKKIEIMVATTPVPVRCGTHITFPY